MGTRFFKIVYSLIMKDHPHAYGDKFFNTAGSAAGVGSSPRVWGQAKRNILDGCMYRIIPTRMGTRNLQGRRGNTATDHPHAYGDKLAYLAYEERGYGSSPRVWGQATYGEGYNQVERIIPTRMGTRNQS